MDITREYLEHHKADLGQRVIQLQQQRADIQAQLHRAEGALLNCDYMLKRLAAPAPEPVTDAPAVEDAPAAPPASVVDLAERRGAPSPPPKT